MDINKCKEVLNPDNIEHFCNSMNDIIFALSRIEDDIPAFNELISPNFAAAMSRLSYYMEDNAPAIITYYEEVVSTLPHFEECLEEANEKEGIG